MTISFSLIPPDVRCPGVYIEIDNTQAARGLPGIPSRILVFGQKLPTGVAVEGVPIQVLDVNQAQGFFGRASQLHRMFVALKANNRFTETWAIPLADDGAADAAVGSVAFSGTVTIPGVLNFYIAGTRVRISVAASEAGSASATKLAAAVNANSDLPVTAAVNGVNPAKVDLTARHRGENGNKIDLRVNYYQGETLPLGLIATIVPMAGGTANPDMTSAIDAMGDTWWTDIILPWTDSANLAVIETELDDRYGPMVMQDAHVYTSVADTHANLLSFASIRNSPHVSTIGAEGSPSMPEDWASALGATCAFHAKIDPARPVQTLPLRGVLPPSTATRFRFEARNQLLFGGISTFRVDDGGTVILERVVTNYQTNPLGVEDISFLDIETLKTIAFIRYAVRNRIQLRFPRHKLASDGANFGAGQAVVTPTIIRNELIALFRELEDAGIVESFSQFKQDLIVERNASDPNRVDAIIPPDVINALRVTAMKIQFLL